MLEELNYLQPSSAAATSFEVMARSIRAGIAMSACTESDNVTTLSISTLCGGWDFGPPDADMQPLARVAEILAGRWTSPVPG